MKKTFSQEFTVYSLFRPMWITSNTGSETHWQLKPPNNIYCKEPPVEWKGKSRLWKGTTAQFCSSTGRAATVPHQSHLSGSSSPKTTKGIPALFLFPFLPVFALTMCLGFEAVAVKVASATKTEEHCEKDYCVLDLQATQTKRKQEETPDSLHKLTPVADLTSSCRC